MTDIVDELRYGHEAATLWHVAREAADTIEALRAENAKLRAALSDIYEITSRAGHLVDAVKRAAAAALKETGNE